MPVKTIEHKWRTKGGLRARLVVFFTIIMICFLIMLLFGCFHPKRPKKLIKKQAHIGTPSAGATSTNTKLVTQKHNYSSELKAAVKNNIPTYNKKETIKKAAIRSRQMRVLRAKRLKRDRERREEVAYIFQDVFPSGM